IVLILFIATVTYTFITVASFLPKYLEEVRSQRLRTEVYQVSQLLLNNPGDPVNWETGNLDINNINRVGLLVNGSDSTNVLGRTKLFSFNTLCGNGVNYQNLKSKFALDFDFSIVLNFTSLSGQSSTFTCEPTIAATGRVNVTLTRIFATESIVNGVNAIDG